MVSVLLQEENALESINVEAKYNYGGKFIFNKSLEGMSLLPIYFLSRATVLILESQDKALWENQTQ